MFLCDGSRTSVLSGMLLVWLAGVSLAAAQDLPDDAVLDEDTRAEGKGLDAVTIDDAASEDMDLEAHELREAKKILYNRTAFEGRPDRRGVSDALYKRPFILGGQRAAVGGYAEVGSTWTKEEGDILGTNFFLKRWNLFVYARLLPRVEFTSELEFENGGTDIEIETAQFDFELLSWLSLRAGVMLMPLGGFNQAHDAPHWPFVDRPLVSTSIIPATFSGMGAALIAEHSLGGNVRINGQLYVTNGLGNKIVGNDTGRVDIPSGKHQGILHEDNNGRPAVSGRLAFLLGDEMELGLSAYRSAYNRWFHEGETYGPRQYVHIGAVDLRAQFWRLEVRGEAALAWIDVPTYMAGILGPRQFGWYLDVYADLWRHTLGSHVPARLRFVVRGEQADYYVGQLADGRRAGDQITGMTTGLAWEVNHQLVVRGAVRNRWTVDILDNPAEKEVQVQLGIASFF